jgi:predicted DNA-binding protein YlxM (UPF0122 family)
MDEKTTKKILKPAACTLPPWAIHIKSENKKEILLKIRQETLQKYGYSMDECPKRLVCLGSKCMGRELPWQSKTAKPYLEELKKTHNIVNGELFLNNCDTCVLASRCKSVCNQLQDYLVRDKTKQVDLYFTSDIDRIVVENEPNYFNNLINLKNLPWDCLTVRRQNTVKKYIYQNKDFLTVANETGLYNQASAKYEFYAALTKLSKYAIMRQFIETKGYVLKESYRSILIEIYNKNKTLQQVAKEKNITKQAVQKKLKKILKMYKIKWPVFVTKVKGKTKYYPKGIIS